MTSQSSSIENKPTIQHKYLDVYPQQLIQTDIKLRKVQQKIQCILNQVKQHHQKNKINSKILLQNSKRQQIKSFNFSNEKYDIKIQQNQFDTIQENVRLKHTDCLTFNQQKEMQNIGNQKLQLKNQFQQNDINVVIKNSNNKMVSFYQSKIREIYQNYGMSQKDCIQYIIQLNNQIKVGNEDQEKQLQNEFNNTKSLQNSLQFLKPIIHQNQEQRDIKSSYEQQISLLQQKIAKLQQENKLLHYQIEHNLFQYQNKLSLLQEDKEEKKKQIEGLLLFKSQQIKATQIQQSQVKLLQCSLAQFCSKLQEQKKQLDQINQNQLKLIDNLQKPSIKEEQGTFKPKIQNNTLQQKQIKLSQLEQNDNNKNQIKQKQNSLNKSINSNPSQPAFIRQPQKQSVSSVPSYMKRSNFKLTIEHTLTLQRYYSQAQQLDKNTYIKHCQKPLFNQPKDRQEKQQIDCLDGLQSPENQLQNDLEQVKFTKVISIQSNQPYDNSQGKQVDNKNGLNLNIMNQVLLVPKDSLGQIQIGLQQIKQKLSTLNSIINHKKFPDINQQHDIGIQPIDQQLSQNKYLKQVKTFNHKDGNMTNNRELKNLNKEIYELLGNLSDLCKAMMQKFEDTIIESQSIETIQKIKFNKQNNSNQNRQFQQQNIKIQNLQPDSQTQVNNKQRLKSQQSVLQTPQDYNKALKLINNQLKILFQTFFNDSKILIQQEQSNNFQLNKQNSMISSQLKIQDQKQILTILSKLSQLHNQLSKKRKQILQSNKQKVQRLFDVIRSLIITFKISYKSINTILQAKQMMDQYKNKYMHLRVYLKTLYSVLQSENIEKNQNTLQDIIAKNRQAQERKRHSFVVFDNYQQKLQKLSSELSKARLELDYKSKQLQNLKELTAAYIQIGQSQKLNYHKSSIHKQKVYQKTNHQIDQVDNKHHIASSQGKIPQFLNQSIKRQHQQNKTEEPRCDNSNEKILLELEQYKKKCRQLESQHKQPMKKNKQKIIYFRK